MKFGTLYSYWGNEWSCDYFETAKKIASLGFDIMEVGAGHLVSMSDDELARLKALSKKSACNLAIAIKKRASPRRKY